MLRTITTYIRSSIQQQNGSISLKSTTGTKQTTDFTAKTSQTSKVIADREMRSMSYISFQSKGNIM